MSRIASDVGFVHLRVHSSFSLLEGALPIKTLAKLAVADRMPALGIADTGNLYGALEFSAKMAENGIQPIIGCQVALDFGDAADRGHNGVRTKQLSDVVLIAALRVLSLAHITPTTRNGRFITRMSWPIGSAPG